MRLLLIRHAQSANNALPEEQRIEDPPITALGHRQAQALASWLQSQPLDHLITSPFRRSLETTAHLRRQLGITPRVWIDLHEQGGCYAGHEPHRYEGRPGMSQREIADEFPDYELDPDIDGQGWWKCRPYETDQQARARAVRLIDTTRTRFGGEECVAYVMHADFKQLFLEVLLADDPAWQRLQASLYNASVSVITLGGGRPRLDDYNATSHLSPDLLSR